MDKVKPARMLGGGRYALLEPAGAGGMAEVWRAELHGAAGFRRPVAIKRVLPHLLDSGPFREMFIEEARVTSALDHPNVVQVFDFGEDEAGLYLAMEWVDGLTLREFGETCGSLGGPPSPTLVAAIGIEILRALEAAHGHKVRDAAGALVPAPVIHRDVTPSNVMLSRRGVVKLADFGLARAYDRARFTPDGIVKGKLAYLAPEQLRGEPASERTDLYSTAIVLWELVAGRRLFQGLTDAELVRWLLDRRPHPALASVRAGVPSALAEAIDRAMSIDPAERFASATDFARVLCEALRQQPERTDASRLAAEVHAAMALRQAQRGAEPSVLDIPVEYSEGATPRVSGVRENDGAATADPARTATG